ncbi:MAG: hypothetical protein HYX32_06700 [Actinobacteria bacterium]|nr:hypothetical protein [Actinomycetota bacterium]
MSAVVRFAFDELNLSRLGLLIQPWNTPSIRMYSRLDHDPEPNG